MFLFDTNVCINASVGREPDASFLGRAIDRNQATLSVITIAEFLSKASLAEQESFSKLISGLPVFEVKLSTAQLASEFRRQSSKRRRSELLDCFLAAQAYENDLILVTNNVADFPMKNIQVKSPAQL